MVLTQPEGLGQYRGVLELSKLEKEVVVEMVVEWRSTLHEHQRVYTLLERGYGPHANVDEDRIAAMLGWHETKDL